MTSERSQRRPPLTAIVLVCVLFRRSATRIAWPGTPGAGRN
jgi:hypothetical protein